MYTNLLQVVKQKVKQNVKTKLSSGSLNKSGAKDMIFVLSWLNQ